MDRKDELADRFQEHRAHLRGIAHRMLGDEAEAEDAVQEAWLRFSRTDTRDVENLRGWLTTVLSRICLNVLRTRRTRREERLDDELSPLIVEPLEGTDPAREAELADDVGVAMLVVLETMAPAERLAFVLHDMFAVPFEEIAPLVDRSPAATRQLASRARRRARGSGAAGAGTRADHARQREVVEAFRAASRAGDFDRLVALLHPDIVLRASFGPGAAERTRELRGAEAVAGQATMFGRGGGDVRVVLVDGLPGQVRFVGGRLYAVLQFTVQDGRVTALDIMADREQLDRVDLSALGEAAGAA